VNPIEERPVLAIGDSLDGLRQGLFGNLSRTASRSNRQIPKDGSEFTSQLAYSDITLPTITGNVISLQIGKANGVVKIDANSSGHLVLGLADGASNDAGGGRVVTLINTGGALISFLHENLFPAAANRLILPGFTGYTLHNRESVVFFYDTVDSRWRLHR